MGAALQILKSAWQDVSKNWLYTIKVFFLPLVIAGLFWLLAMAIFPFHINETRVEFKIAEAPLSILALIPVFVALAWGAVRFHRYIVLDELPEWFAFPPVRAIFKYILWSLLIWLVIITALLGVLMIAGSIAFAFMDWEVMLTSWIISVLVFLISIVLEYFFLRIAPILVDRATEHRRYFHEIWGITGDHKTTIWSLALIVNLIYYIPDFILQIPIFPAEVLGAVSAILVGLFGAINIALLTETYRRYFTN